MTTGLSPGSLRAPKALPATTRISGHPGNCRCKPEPLPDIRQWGANRLTEGPGREGLLPSHEAAPTSCPIKKGCSHLLSHQKSFIPCPILSHPTKWKPGHVPSHKIRIQSCPIPQKKIWSYSDLDWPKNQDGTFYSIKICSHLLSHLKSFIPCSILSHPTKWKFGPIPSHKIRIRSCLIPRTKNLVLSHPTGKKSDPILILTRDRTGPEQEILVRRSAYLHSVETT